MADKKLSERNRQQTRRRQNLPAIGLAAALLVVWQLIAMAVNIPHILPTPTAIVATTWRLRKTLLLSQLPVTLWTVLVGWLLSCGIAILLATLMRFSKRAEAMLLPVLIVTQTVPVMCITPLFVLWFGYTQAARLCSVVLSVFFAITLDLYEGFRGTDRDKIELMRSMGAGRLEIFFRLEVPSAWPMFLTGIKMTFPWAVIDAAVAEWLGATKGLGYFSKRMVTKMDGPAVFAPILILTLLALAGMGVIGLVERRTAWYRNQL